ncbi:MAG: hypothetical protein ABFR65_04835 [Pseudomonadota bacterium]
MILTKYAALAVFINLLFFFNSRAANAAETADPGAWQQSAALYVWLPTLDGELKYQREGDEPFPVDISDMLDMAFMGAYEARKNKWSILGDLIYLDLGDDKDRDNRLYNKVELDLKGWQVGLYGGYNLYQTGRSNLDLLAGLRYLTIETESNLTSNQLPPLTLSQDVDLWDGVIGLRGRTNINENWFIPYQADIGTGDSDLTWQAMAGIAYQASWGDTRLAYRYLEWDQGDDDLLQKLSFSGPQIAVAFYF